MVTIAIWNVGKLFYLRPVAGGCRRSGQIVLFFMCIISLLDILSESASYFNKLTWKYKDEKS